MSIQIFASQHKHSYAEFGIEYSFFIGRIRECVHKKTVYLFTVSVSFICLGHEYRALLFRVEEQCAQLKAIHLFFVFHPYFRFIYYIYIKLSIFMPALFPPQKNDQGKEEAQSFSWKLVGQNNFSWGFFRSSLIRKKRKKKKKRHYCHGQRNSSRYR